MKLLARYVCLIVVFALILAIPAYATDNHSIEASNFFARTSAYLTKSSGTTFYINFNVTGVDIMEKIGVSYIELQESSDDSSWGPVAYYYMSNYSSMTDSNTAGHAGYFTYTGVKNNYYRAYVEFYAKDDSGEGYFSTHTTSIKVP